MAVVVIVVMTMIMMMIMTAVTIFVVFIIVVVIIVFERYLYALRRDWTSVERSVRPIALRVLPCKVARNSTYRYHAN